MIRLSSGGAAVGQAERFRLEGRVVDAVADDVDGGESYRVLCEYHTPEGVWLPNHRARRQGVKPYDALTLAAEAMIGLSFHYRGPLVWRTEAWDVGLCSDGGQVVLLADGEPLATLSKKDEWQILAKQGQPAALVLLTERVFSPLALRVGPRSRPSALAEAVLR